MSEFNIAYGTTENDNGHIRLNTAIEHANVYQIFDEAEGHSIISFDRGFKDSPSVVATAIASSEKQVRINQRGTRDNEVREKVHIDTYDQDGSENLGRQRIPYGFLAVSGGTKVDADVNNLGIVACMVSDTDEGLSLPINYDGATISSDIPGRYQLDFGKRFITPPTVVVTLVQHSEKEATAVFRSVVVSKVTKTQAVLESFNAEGDHRSASFNVVVIGQVEGHGNGNHFDIACGHVNDFGRHKEFTAGITDVKRDLNATYTITWDSGYFNDENPPIVLALAEHNPRKNLRQAQVWPNLNSKESKVQIAQPDDDDFERCHFQVIAIAHE